VTLALLLNIMEGWNGLRFASPDLLHREAEAMRRAFTERNRSLGDPAFVRCQLARLLSKEYAAAPARPDRPEQGDADSGVRPYDQGRREHDPFVGR
jgi:gamma-glutamyltranspeptidase/glutathione hydrolase